MTNLNMRAWFGLAFVAVVMALVLFIAAGTTDYWQAWTYLGIFLGASFLITLYLVENDPALLRRRLSAGPTAEKERTQKIVMLFASVGFIAMLVLPALDHRFKWTSVPLYATIGGDILTGLSFFITFLVYKENSFTSAIVEVTQDQRVISSGPYAVVRHPLYAGGTLLFLGTPFALGSYWGLLALPMTLPALIWRLLDEERLLSRNLSGYTQYCQKVRWRLIPGVF